MPTRAPARLLACLAACLLGATGCTGPGPSPEAGSSPTASASTPADTSTRSETPSTPGSPEESASPSASPTASSAAPSDGASPGPVRGPLRARLLSAAELPGFNEETGWRGGPTQSREPRRFGTCQRFGLLSIGAERVVVRRFLPTARGTRDRAGELVAAFPDALTARRAFAVLKSWRSRCAHLLRGYRDAEVGDLQDVAVPGGSAGWYLLTYGPVPRDPQSHFFDAQGMALKGSRIAMVAMVLAGQDYNYEAGREPMVAALERAAAKL